MDGSVAWRAALIDACALPAAALVLAAALPRSCFEDYGWVAGQRRGGRPAAAAG